MSRTNSISVFSFLMKDSAILPTDGNKLHDTIDTLLGKDKKSIVEIDFTEMKYITSAFVNASIGKYLLKYPENENRLRFKTLPEQELDFRIQRSVSLATNEALRKAHNIAVEEVLCD